MYIEQVLIIIFLDDRLYNNLISIFLSKVRKGAETVQDQYTKENLLVINIDIRNLRYTVFFSSPYMFHVSEIQHTFVLLFRS